MADTTVDIPDTDSLVAMQLFGRTVWVANGLGAHQESDVLDPGAMAGPYQHYHEARLRQPSSYRPDQVMGPQEIEKGVRAQLGKPADSDQATPISYQFDSTLFSLDQAKAWLATKGVDDATWLPDEQMKPKTPTGSREEGEKPPREFSDLATFYSRTVAVA
jgi:hypothetical protein